MHKRILLILAVALGVLVVPSAASAAWIDLKIIGHGHVQQIEGDKDLHCTSPAETPTGAEGNRCGSSESFNTNVKFRADVLDGAAGWEFAGWEGSCGGLGLCDFWTHVGVYTVTARFVDTGRPTPTITSGPDKRKPVASREATFDFNADEAGVRFECAVDGVPKPCDSNSRHTVTGLESGDHRFQLVAIDPSGNRSHVVEWPWTVDVTGPATQITAAPNGPTNATSASFRLATDDGATLRCRIDGGAWEICDDGYERYNLPHGFHVFEAYAIDELRNAGPVVPHRWEIDTMAPVTTLDPGVGPAEGSATDARGARFSFAANEPLRRFECAVDGGAFRPCASPQELSGLGLGAHAFRVQAVDHAGNTGRVAVRNWRVVAPPPPDRDRDGYSPPADCRDDDPAIHPGAHDVPGNAVDEDCKNGPAPAEPLGAGVRGYFATQHGRTRVLRLDALRVPAGTRIAVRTCRKARGGCATRVVTVPSARPRVALKRLAGRKSLPRGARLAIRMTRPETIGRAVTFTMRGNKLPRRVDVDLKP